MAYDLHLQCLFQSDNNNNNNNDNNNNNNDNNNVNDFNNVFGDAFLYTDNTAWKFG
jgi:hypothetical protein